MADRPASPALDPATVEVTRGTSYPPEFDEACAAREKRRVGNALGLKNFGVNLVTLPPAPRPPSGTGTRTRTSSSTSSRARRR